MKPRISMITLGVYDLEKSVRFYKDGLGFPQMKSSPEAAFFTLNGTWLGLYHNGALANDAQVSDVGQGFNRFALAHNLGSESEVDTAIAHALSAGAKLTKAAQTTPWGGYSGYFKDPDSHLWEVAYNPYFWIGPKDD